jgi:HTH-type transcriptional regulator/antitoxin HigA
MKRYDSDAIPAMIIHPGELLKDEIDARGISQKELAEKMGRPTQVISLIVNGRKGISEETALDLEKDFNGELTADFWLNLDTHYRLDVARQRRQLRKAS